MLIVPVAGFKCPDCETLYHFDDESLEPLYECGKCGEVFLKSNSYDGDSHKCPSCGAFGSKVTPKACPDCEVEVESEFIHPCPVCDELFLERDEVIDHLVEEHPDDVASS